MKLQQNLLDEEGYRAGVGMVVVNSLGQVLWARRIRQNAWQFPQGGILPNEAPEETVYRELYEELGLEKEDVEVMASTRHWLSYRLPERLLRPHVQPLCVGQKQKWFLLRLVTEDKRVRLNLTDSPEFDKWRWVYYWYPIKQVIAFKRHVYRRALEELADHVPQVDRRKIKTGNTPSHFAHLSSSTSLPMVEVTSNAGV